jgi:hypothetical protein
MPDKKPRYSFSVVEEMVLNPDYLGYRGGRVEVFDRESEDDYAVYEARFLVPERFFQAFYDMWDGEESDLMPRITWEFPRMGK